MALAASEAEFAPVALRLRDETEVTLRAVRPQDGDMLQTAIRGLSSESRYSRFFSHMRELTPQLLERATNPEGERELQLVAIVPADAGEVIVGGARYAGTEGSKDCEFAIAVADEWHGRGLARQLLEALMRTACERGFERMEGYILASNAAMLGLAKRLGFERVPSPEGPAVALVRRDLATLV